MSVSSPYITLKVHFVPNLLPGSLCGWTRKSLHLLEEGQNHLIVRVAHLCRMICKEFVSNSFLYIQLFELGVEIAFIKRFAVTPQHSQSAQTLHRNGYNSNAKESIENNTQILTVCIVTRD